MAETSKRNWPWKKKAQEKIAHAPESIESSPRASPHNSKFFDEQVCSATYPHCYVVWQVWCCEFCLMSLRSWVIMCLPGVCCPRRPAWGKGLPIWGFPFPSNPSSLGLVLEWSQNKMDFGEGAGTRPGIFSFILSWRLFHTPNSIVVSAVTAESMYRCVVLVLPTI